MWCGLPMKLAFAWLMTALAAAVAFPGGAREPRVSALFRADMADALPAGDPVHAPRTSPVSFVATEARLRRKPRRAGIQRSSHKGACNDDRCNPLPSVGVRRRQ